MNVQKAYKVASNSQELLPEAGKTNTSGSQPQMNRNKAGNKNFHN